MAGHLQWFCKNVSFTPGTAQPVTLQGQAALDKLLTAFSQNPEDASGDQIAVALLFKFMISDDKVLHELEELASKRLVVGPAAASAKASSAKKQKKQEASAMELAMEAIDNLF